MSETDRTLASARKNAGSRPGGPGRPLSDYEVYLFNEGTSTRAYNALGAHPSHRGGEAGTFFAVWAPNAQAMSVIGEWNHWTPGQDRLEPRGSSG
ncbi:MAG: 1,4-alpha-glucan branching enzyme, partial [Thermoplasmata archaeon]